ncbi:hypothetical protein [Paralysiella testudinis]|uniref:Uncharacterized protein n=1 Tax=Paralysiella testudinis TaxID=2809020 RepID=A0A892ZLC9_9NEIS|nr:hypothetical protein [Paralysiella testudinis]QRQ81699.1 hypothetical protein JQU52_13590 [Paralysiella testudinis]
MDYFKNMLWFYAFSYRFTLRFMAARPLTFLCFAHAKRTYGEQSKQKKGDPGCRFGCAKGKAARIFRFRQPEQNSW